MESSSVRVSGALPGTWLPAARALALALRDESQRAIQRRILAVGRVRADAVGDRRQHLAMRLIRLVPLQLHPAQLRPGGDHAAADLQRFLRFRLVLLEAQFGERRLRRVFPPRGQELLTPLGHDSCTQLRHGICDLMSGKAGAIPNTLARVAERMKFTDFLGL